MRSNKAAEITVMIVSLLDLLVSTTKRALALSSVSQGKTLILPIYTYLLEL